MQISSKNVLYRTVTVIIAFVCANFFSQSFFNIRQLMWKLVYVVANVGSILTEHLVLNSSEDGANTKGIKLNCIYLLNAHVKKSLKHQLCSFNCNFRNSKTAACLLHSVQKHKNIEAIFKHNW